VTRAGSPPGVKRKGGSHHLKKKRVEKSNPGLWAEKKKGRAAPPTVWGRLSDQGCEKSHIVDGMALEERGLGRGPCKRRGEVDWGVAALENGREKRGGR